MGLFDKFTGTRHPAEGVTPRSAEEVRAALLALNGPDVPFRVRAATPGEKADLAAELRIREPAWATLFARSRLDRAIKIRMRLVPQTREVRALDEQWEVTWVGDTPTLSVSREYGRGQVRETSRSWTIERSPDGRRHLAETFHFDSADFKNPLRDAVLDAGWTWRGVTFRL